MNEKRTDTKRQPSLDASDTQRRQRQPDTNRRPGRTGLRLLLAAITILAVLVPARVKRTQALSRGAAQWTASPSASGDLSPLPFSLDAVGAATFPTANGHIGHTTSAASATFNQPFGLSRSAEPSSRAQAEGRSRRSLGGVYPPKY